MYFGLVYVEIEIRISFNFVGYISFICRFYFICRNVWVIFRDFIKGWVSKKLFSWEDGFVRLIWLFKGKIFL